MSRLLLKWFLCKQVESVLFLSCCLSGAHRKTASFDDWQTCHMYSLWEGSGAVTAENGRYTLGIQWQSSRTHTAIGWTVKSSYFVTRCHFGILDITMGTFYPSDFFNHVTYGLVTTSNVKYNNHKDNINVEFNITLKCSVLFPSTVMFYSCLLNVPNEAEWQKKNMHHYQYTCSLLQPGLSCMSHNSPFICFVFALFLINPVKIHSKILISILKTF